jgi:hypothetical protein
MSVQDTTNDAKLHTKITELEDTYRKLVAILEASNEATRIAEYTLFECLKKLVPMLKNPDMYDSAEFDRLNDQHSILNTSISESKEIVMRDKSNMLDCLRQLMPVQITYLGGIIKNLKDQLDTRDAKHESELSKLRNVRSDNVSQPNDRLTNEHPSPHHRKISANLEKISE